MEALRLAIASAAKAQKLYVEQCANVWHALKAADPEVADAISDLGLDEKRAAAWVCRSATGLDGSPAQEVATGHRDEVLAGLVRTKHGLF